jgi:hypothetical protein
VLAASSGAAAAVDDVLLHADARAATASVTSTNEDERERDMSGSTRNLPFRRRTVFIERAIARQQRDARACHLHVTRGLRAVGLRKLQRQA